MLLPFSIIVILAATTVVRSIITIARTVKILKSLVEGKETAYIENVAVVKFLHYICGDSNNIDKLVEKNDFDFCFTSPPYYDLEVYSKNDMSALGTYEEFMQSYENIFRKCYAKLKNDTFLVVKICEIRDKKTGVYRGFVPDNLKCFEKIGWHFYNEIILINAIGTGALRANVNMKTRKVVKVHQNVLVFYKGDVKNIAEKYPADEFFNSELLNGGSENELSQLS